MSTPELEVIYGDETTYVGPATDAPARPATQAQATQRSSTRHSALTIALHWGTVTSIVVSVGAILVRDALENDGIRALLLDLHRQLGLAVLLAAGARIVARWIQPLSDHGAMTSRLTRLAAGGTHLLIYGLLFALPLVGWAVVSAHDSPLTLFGLATLPPLVQEDSDLADTLGNVHVWLAWALLVLVLVHAGAALWHHYVRRDNVLRAMLPGHD